MTVAAPPALAERARLRLAGATVSLATSSEALGALLTRPFAHLPAAAGPADLRVEAWTGAPALPTGPDRIELGDGGALVAHVRPEGSVALDRREGLLRAWWPSEDALPAQDRTKPFVLTLALWLADRGLVLAHAGCVGRDGRAVLLVGPSGSGKSTASLACAARGLDYLGDDQVAVALDAGRPVAHSLFATARLAAAHLAAHPSLTCGGPALETGEDKRLLVLGESAARLVPAAEVAAVAIVRRGPGRLVRASRAEALRALAPNTLARMPLGPAAFHALADLTAAVPAVALETATPDAVPALVERVLAGELP